MAAITYWDYKSGYKDLVSGHKELKCYVSWAFSPDVYLTYDPTKALHNPTWGLYNPTYSPPKFSTPTKYLGRTYGRILDFSFGALESVSRINFR